MQYSFFFLIIIIGLLISDPSFWVVLGISIVLLVVVVIACIVDLFRSISKPSRQSSSHKTSNQSVKNTGKISSFKDWSQSVDKNEPNKKSDDILDEKIPTQELIKLRNILNLIDLSGEFKKDTRDEIIGKLLPVKSSQFDNETTTRLKNIDLNTARNFFISYRDMLNSKDLESFEFVTARELMSGFATEEEMQDAVERENSRNQTNQEYDDYDDCDEYEEYDDDDYEQPNWNENHNSAKQKRIKNLKKDVNRLNREYRFERGFDPDWDEDDRLSEKYRHDEEKYLRARKLELEERNRSYDNYLAPDERDRFKDETDEEW